MYPPDSLRPHKGHKSIRNSALRPVDQGFPTLAVPYAVLISLCLAPRISPTPPRNKGDKESIMPLCPALWGKKCSEEASSAMFIESQSQSLMFLCALWGGQRSGGQQIRNPSVIVQISPHTLSLAIQHGWSIPSQPNQSRCFHHRYRPSLIHLPTLITRHRINHPATIGPEHPKSLINRDLSAFVSIRNVEIQASRIGFQGGISCPRIVRLRVRTTQERSSMPFPFPGEGWIESVRSTSPLKYREGSND
jgi:hypothetical protein